MNTDIRLKTALRHHRKIKRLVNRLGAVAPWNLIQLWLSASENRPEGILTGYTIEDIADDADWQGDPNVFVSALLECKWLDKLEDGTYALHDWKEHQPYVSHSEDRSEQARHAARTRWAKQGACSNDAHLCSEHAGSIQAACGQHADSNTDFEMSNAPSPSPDPSPTPKPAPSPNQISEEREISDPRKTTTTARARAKDDDEAGKPPPDDPSPDKMPLSRACELYRTCFAGNHLQIPQVTADKLKTLIARYSRADLEAAFDAAANSGAKSLKYLEATIEGKRQNKEPTAKRRAKKGESDNGWRCKDITGHWNPEGRGERGISRPADGRTSPWGDIGAITTEELDACIDAGLGKGRLSNAPIQPGAG